MRKLLVYLSSILLVSCTTARMQNLPAPLLSQAKQFNSLEKCEAKLAELFKTEDEKRKAGEDYVDLSEARCEEQGPDAGEVAAGFFILVLGAATGGLLYLDSKY